MRRSAPIAQTRGSWPRALPLLLALLLWGAPARAWIEQTVVGHETRVEVEESGWVGVRHQLTLSLRGGPLKSLEIEGIGDDVELSVDAKVTRVQGNNTAGLPLRLSLAEGGALRIETLAGEGLRSGTYRFDFGYRLDAAKKKLLEPHGDQVTFTWVGPRLSGGVDAAKVVIAVAHAGRPPALLASPERAARAVLLGQVLVGSERDEIELLRTHVAVGEPAVWQVDLDRAALSGALADDPLAPQRISGSQKRTAPRGPSPWQIALCASLGLLVGLLVYFKERAVAVLSRETESRTRPLVPSPPWARALLTAALAVSFVTLALSHRAALAMASGFALAAFCVHLPPVRRSVPRGLGTWAPLGIEALAPRTWPLLVRAFDSSTLLGSFLALGVLCSGAAVAYLRLPHDDYQALMSLAFVLLLLPVFLTGRRADFPRSPAEQALPWFRFLEKTRLGSVRAIELWGRHTGTAQGLGPVDEVRLRIALERPPSGLRALEVAFEEGPGDYLMPCVVLRAIEDSPARERLPKEIAWTRGRQSEEKTAILHPRAPTRGQLRRLLCSLVAHLQRPAPETAPPSPPAVGSSASTRAPARRGAPVPAAPLASSARA